MIEILCGRCGVLWESQGRQKEFAWCPDCRARKTLKAGECLPWHGHFANDLTTPVDERGEPVLPGRRICNNSDCCNPKHIERETWQQ